MNNIEKTLAIIKPDGFKYKKEIISKILSSDLIIKKIKITKLDENILKEHYSHLLDKQFYEALEDYMMSDIVIILLIEGEDAVNKLRSIMGPTDSKKANKDTIRGMYGKDLMYNVIHGSDTKDNASKEIKRFFNVKR